MEEDSGTELESFGGGGESFTLELDPDVISQGVRPVPPPKPVNKHIGRVVDASASLERRHSTGNLLGIPGDGSARETTVRVEHTAAKPKRPTDDDESFSFTEFEEVPGAYEDGFGYEEDEDAAVPNPVLEYNLKARRAIVTGFVLGLLCLFTSLFLFASVVNGGLPIYAVEQATKLSVPYEEIYEVDGIVGRDGTWAYYRFQTHHSMEGVHAQVETGSTDGTVNPPPLAVYLAIDILPSAKNYTQPVEVGTSEQLPPMPNTSSDETVVCGPRTVYVGVVCQYYTFAGAQQAPLNFTLSLYRDEPEPADQYCQSYLMWMEVFVFVIQPLLTGALFLGSLVACAFGVLMRRRAEAFLDESAASASRFRDVISVNIDQFQELHG